MANTHIPVISVTSDSEATPEWAKLQQELRRTISHAAQEFVTRYTRSDGTLIWRSEWPGMDGSDDPYEAFQYLALFYAVTGDEEVYRLGRQMWDSITWQWTEYGQIHEEFDGYYDWMHHGEANLFHYFFGLTKPDSLKDRSRAKRFADLYNGHNTLVDNWDPELKMIRAPQSGSKGPRHVVTKEDLGTHRGVLDDYLAPFEDMKTSPFELGKCNWSNDDVFDEVVRLMNERTTRGDVPLNLNATGQMTHAFMYSADPLLKTWVLEYLEVWASRAEENGGIMPDNVGLSGVVGEYLDGKWWGGHYGWRWPHGLFTIMEPLVNACTNAYLLTGDPNWLDAARKQLDENFALGHQEGDQYLTPNKHFDAGWTDYRPANPFHAIHLWARSLDPDDRQRVERARGTTPWNEVTHPKKPFSAKHYNVNTVPWYEFITGAFPEYPQRALKENLALVDQQLARLRSKDGDPRTWDTVEQINGYPDSLSMQIDGYAIHAWMEFCPVYFESLVQLQWGAPMHISHGGFQHATLRYYNAATERPGLPEGVSALVHDISPTSAQVTFVNDSDSTQQIVIQAGAFQEHGFTSVSNQGTTTPVDSLSPWVQVGLEPGSHVLLELGMKRYVHQPSYETPWSTRDDWDPIITPRNLNAVN